MVPISPLATDLAERGAVLLNRSELDLERVLLWLRTCNASHGACHSINSLSHAAFSNKSMFLVSTSRMCLVKTDVRKEYVALSYVWGPTVPKFMTTKATVKSLQEVGSLSSMMARDMLPGTIERAIRLALLLKLEYLWTDCLCIVQDDPIHVASQLECMSEIFSNSYLTLCAADGLDAESGFSGVPGCSQPRSIRQELLSFSDGFTTSHWIHLLITKVEAWDQRAWTFQEDVLSRRTLEFRDCGLKWRCQEALAEEQEADIRRATNDFIDLNIILADSDWPCIRKWNNILDEYLSRSLKYEEDILRAFSGILDALRMSFDGFYYGLPAKFFDLALLWIPKEPLSRRKIDNKKDTDTTVNFPSWSWAGWIGERSNQIGAFGLDHERTTPLTEKLERQSFVYPCVDWFKFDPECCEKFRISNDYAKYREGGLDGSIVLPAGWSSRREGSKDDGELYYEYKFAPSDHTFWYPVPVNRNSHQMNDYQSPPFLYCRTSRGYLEIGSSLSHEVEEYYINYPIYSLITSEEKWAGVIFVHQHPEINDEAKEQCELIVVSGGIAFEDADWIPELRLGDRPRTRGQYSFYNVLWIEWQSGIAYRKGVGRVVKQVWDSLAENEVDVILG
jgi:Heterokaryon incompatibility protein (HET)